MDERAFHLFNLWTAAAPIERERESYPNGNVILAQIAHLVTLAIGNFIRWWVQRASLPYSGLAQWDERASGTWHNCFIAFYWNFLWFFLFFIDTTTNTPASQNILIRYQISIAMIEINHILHSANCASIFPWLFYSKLFYASSWNEGDVYPAKTEL